jgi:hypothetical protein
MMPLRLIRLNRNAPAALARTNEICDNSDISICSTANTESFKVQVPMSQDFLLRRLRDTIARLSQNQTRPTEPFYEAEQTVRNSIRQLSRSRISQLLRQLRAAHGYSYAQVQAATGLSQQLLFDIEFKDRRLTMEELRRLADCYQVSVSDILGVDVEDIAG